MTEPFIVCPHQKVYVHAFDVNWKHAAGLGGVHCEDDAAFPAEAPHVFHVYSISAAAFDMVYRYDASVLIGVGAQILCADKTVCGLGHTHFQTVGLPCVKCKRRGYECVIRHDDIVTGRDLQIAAEDAVHL